MAKLAGFVPDHILRNYAVRGQTVTVCKGSDVRVHADPMNKDFTTNEDIRVEVVNFLPGYESSPGAVHNHRVVWRRVVTKYTKGVYCSTDINNVQEVRDGKD
jgi:hypothetical protein